MRITWQNDRFEAVLTPGDLWQADMEAAKAAGFKTDGPPAWTWASYKALPLVQLKTNRPASGLSITPDALRKFQEMLPGEEKNAALLEMLKDEKKKIKKAQVIEERANDIPEYWQGKNEIGREDLPLEILAAATQRLIEWKRPKPPKLRCVVCDEPVYFYETQDPPTCLYCEMHPGWPAENVSI